mgnify:CR=1 FL=1
MNDARQEIKEMLMSQLYSLEYLHKLVGCVRKKAATQVSQMAPEN